MKLFTILIIFTFIFVELKASSYEPVGNRNYRQTTAQDNEPVIRTEGVTVKGKSLE
jgi:hypothetical protein